MKSIKILYVRIGEKVLMKKGKIYKRLFILAIAVYIVFTLVNQQKTLNQYTQTSKELNEQIDEQKSYKEELAKEKDNVDSLEFIEQTAREKLDMYYPNERVYIDSGM
jgi:cell division protein FtsB